MDSVNEAALLALMERTKYPMLQVSELHFTKALGTIAKSLATSTE